MQWFRYNHKFPVEFQEHFHTMTRRAGVRGSQLYLTLQTHRHILKQKVAPLVLHVKEEPEHECDVHDADEEDHDHPRVDGEPVPPACLGALLSQSHHGQTSGNYILRKDNSRKLLEHKKNTCWKTYKILLHCLCYPVRC